MGRDKRVEQVSAKAFGLPLLRPVAQSFVTAMEFLPGMVWYPVSPVGVRLPCPEQYSRMCSLSERASHLSFISRLLDITCCNFSRICGEEREEVQALVMLPTDQALTDSCKEQAWSISSGFKS